MSKDYLLVEHKDRCWDCDLMRIEEMYEIPFCGRTGGKVEMDGKPEWCPLRPLPERKEEMNYLATGWNLCLDAIEEGNDD